MESRLSFVGKRMVELEEFVLPGMSAGKLKVRTVVSLMSTGTESIAFNHDFAEGTHWDDWVRYPFYPGYSSVGVVEEVCPGSLFKVGDTVVHDQPHASCHLVDEDNAVLVPDCVDVEEAGWFCLARIASMGARAARHFPGDCVLVIGAGPIGQMSVRWANAAGATTIIAADLAESRLKLAMAGGATHIFAGNIAESFECVMSACAGGLPDVVIDTTGNAKVFHEALSLVKDNGKLVLLGDTGNPSLQRLTKDVLVRGVIVVGAYIGNMDCGWRRRKIIDVFFKLVSSERFSLAGLVKHRFSPMDAVAAYELSNASRGETMGILFDWRKI